MSPTPPDYPYVWKTQPARTFALAAFDDTVVSLPHADGFLSAGTLQRGELFPARDARRAHRALRECRQARWAGGGGGGRIKLFRGGTSNIAGLVTRVIGGTGGAADLGGADFI